MNTWPLLLVNALIAGILASGVQWFLARSQRRKTDAETTGLRTDVMTKVDLQTDRAIERADKALRRVEWLEQYVDVLKEHNDQLETVLRQRGWQVPPAPVPPPYPGG